MKTMKTTKSILFDRKQKGRQILHMRLQELPRHTPRYLFQFLKNKNKSKTTRLQQKRNKRQLLRSCKRNNQNLL